MMLFPFYLADKAKMWLRSHEPETFIIWDDIAKAFSLQFFPPKKVAQVRNLISNFEQKKMSYYMKHGKGTKVFLDLVHNIVLKNDWLFIYFITV